VVYAKPPFGGPEHVLKYLARYTHRVAISNGRLLSLENGQVRFRWRDSRHNNRSSTMRLDAGEFIRRFLLHVLPAGFIKIRHFGLLANRNRRQALALCRAHLCATARDLITLLNEHQTSARIPVSTFRYESMQDPRTALRLRIREIAQTQVRYGYRKIRVLLNREGWKVGKKLVYRLYREEGLTLRHPPRKRRRAVQHRRERFRPTGPNQAWTLDFVADQ
jgi:Putative transposase/HTH-like domain